MSLKLIGLISGVMLFFLFQGCSNLSQSTITYSPINQTAILLGETIYLLDSNLNITKNISKFHGTPVTVNAISDSLFNASDDYCDAFHYVKISNSDYSGWVDGRNVYAINNTKPLFFVENKQQIFPFFTTSFFGIGVADENGLTFCNKYYQPLVILQKDHYHFISLKNTPLGKKANSKSNFQYFEWRNDDGAADKIISSIIIDDHIILNGIREYQEGYNEFKVKLNIKNSKYQAEYIDISPIKYE